MLQNGCVSYNYDTEQQLAFANQHEGRGYCFCSTLARLAGANMHAGLTNMRSTQFLHAKLGGHVVDTTSLQPALPVTAERNICV